MKVNFYLELNRHGIDEEDHVNKILLEFSKKYNIKTIACNDVFYLNKEDSTAHDILLCIKQGEYISTPIGRGRGKRFGYSNDQYYFKSKGEMIDLFNDIPESLTNLSSLLIKIEDYDLERDVVLPIISKPT